MYACLPAAKEVVQGSYECKQQHTCIVRGAFQLRLMAFPNRSFDAMLYILWLRAS